MPKLQEALREVRSKRFGDIRDRHKRGATGGQIVASITGLADEIIEGVYKEVILSVPPDIRWKLQDGLAIIALGGYGRGELAPYSDIDLMFLHRGSVKEMVQNPVAGFLQMLWDIGYRVGHSVRSIEDCTKLAREDLTIRTALMEARFLEGSQRLFDRFRTHFSRKIGLKHPASYLSQKLAIRQKEYEEYGTTVHLLEPHIKMSKGGLRDIHLLKWAALSHYQTASLESLKDKAMLSSREYAVLSEAQDFLWHVRNELHFSAGRCQDRLTFDEQVRVASLWGFRDQDHLLAVEQFMKQYYEHTTEILAISHRFVSQCATPSLKERLLKIARRRSLSSLFLLRGREISIKPDKRVEVLDRLRNWIQLFSLSQLYHVELSQDTLMQLQTSRESRTIGTDMDDGGASLFMEILGRAHGVGKVLRELHRLKLLEILIPEFAQARGLMQFNEYHKYTVDEHCIRAVEEAELLGQPANRTAGVYRETQRKDLLHLALLLHDLGKGQGSDHSEVGVQIARGLAARFHLDPSSTKVLLFLIQYHLIMTRIAFRRDLSDEKVILQFAKLVATPETLRMLYLLTLADIAAVGPGTLTAWKQDLLAELFTNTLEVLTGEGVERVPSERIENTKAWLQSRYSEEQSGWVLKQLSNMTVRYIRTTPKEQILVDLEGVRSLESAPVVVDSRYDPKRKTTQYTVYGTVQLKGGVFYKISGALAARGLQILSASITTWNDGTIVDTFQVEDPDFIAAPSERKLLRVKEAITEVLLDRIPVEALLTRGWRIQDPIKPFRGDLSTQVEVDNTSSDQYTIIEVFGEDRQGLLFIIARTMFEMGLSVHTAKVSTQLDQIVDAFYVTGPGGGKLTDPVAIQEVQKRLVDEIGHFHKEAQGKPSFKPLGKER